MMEAIINILKSSSKILAFCIFFGGFALSSKLIGVMEIEASVKVFGGTILAAGLLSGSKVFQDIAKDFFAKKFG